MEYIIFLYFFHHFFFPFSLQFYEAFMAKKWQRDGAWGYREQGEEAGREGGRIYWWIVWYFRPRALFLRQILLVSPMAVLLYTLLDVLNFVCSPCQFPYR